MSMQSIETTQIRTQQQTQQQVEATQRNMEWAKELEARLGSKPTPAEATAYVLMKMANMDLERRIEAIELAINVMEGRLVRIEKKLTSNFDITTA